MRFLGFPVIRARRAILVVLLVVVNQVMFTYVSLVGGNMELLARAWFGTTQSSTLAITYTLSVLSFPALIHSYIEETKSSDLENKSSRLKKKEDKARPDFWQEEGFEESAFEANVILFYIAHRYVSATF